MVQLVSYAMGAGQGYLYKCADLDLCTRLPYTQHMALSSRMRPKY